MPHKKAHRSLFGGYLSVLNNKLRYKRGFSLTELLIALAIVAVIAVLLIPVITTRAQNRSFAVSYDTEVKQMLNSLESLPVSENKEDIESTMMFVKEGDIASYANNAGAYINKYMKVVKYCGDTPGDCFASMYYLYNTDNERVEFPINGIKGACALLKNGVSICLKPQIKKENGAIQEIQGWIDLNGPKEPNIYGRDLRTFTIDLKHKAIFTNEATKVLLIKPDPTCKGKDCGCVGDDCDPCKIDDRSEACCKQEGYVARAVDEANPDPDPCCPYFRNETGANHDICYGPEPPCDHDVDPTCEDYCFHHTILGPDDECCAVLSAKGISNPNCCTNDSDSDYCCSIHPETEKCCKKRIDNGKLELTADNVCCTKYQSIYNEYDACKSDCEVDNNSEKCCNSKERREQINNPDDQCCKYAGVNGLLDAEAAGNPYNKYCCRLPKNASEQCCKWKYDHIGSSLDFYTQHDYNKNKEVGSYDACCEGNVRGIRFAGGKSDAKSQAVLNRCCTLNQEKSNADEDRICCDYLVGQKGNSFLKDGQALRRCCKYDNHKNKPECCSNVNDGMAFNMDVSWASQCCMPNSLYPNDVKPNKQCCFVNTSITGESNSFWKNKRWTDCCSYGNQDYNGHKINTEAQWQKNCCSLTRAQYPSDAAYNAACCVANAAAKEASPSRDSWQYFSQTKNECCETLDNQYGESGRNDHWASNCCYGWKGGNFATKNPYYNLEAKCCMLDKNWTEACCTLANIDKTSAKWKKNCCDNPTLYGTNKNSVYRENCCDTNANDYTRKNHGADTDTGLNAKNVDLTKHREYCCHPDAVDPHVECCKLYSSSDNTWHDRDSNTISMDYQIKCCEKSPSAAVTYCPNSCHVRWETSQTYNYDFSRCCKDRALETNRGSVNRTRKVWRDNCCAYAPVAKKGNNNKAYASFEDYRKGCCKSGVEQTFKDGNDGSNQDNINCCIPNGVTATVSGKTTTFSGIIPSEDCCRAFSDNGWKDFDDSVQLNDDYKIACCAKYNICDDSCEIRSKSNVPANYDLPRCCRDSDMEARHKNDTEWQQVCCVSGSIDDTCCDLGFVDQCSCAKRIAKGHSLDLKVNNVNCCYATQSSRSSLTKVDGSNKTQGEHWKSQCCKYSNPGQLTDNEFKSYSCCKNGSDGLVLDGNNSSLCCDNSCTLSSFCCATGSNPKQCTCEERKNLGYNLNTNSCNVNCCPSLVQSDPSNAYVISDCCAIYTDNQSGYKNWAANCCSSTKSYSNNNWKNACCPSPSSNYSGLSGNNYKNTCCLSPRDGLYYGGGSTQNTTCCSTDYKNSSFCCSKLGKSYCTCDLQWTYYKSSFDTSCCSDLSSHASDSDWQSKCCTLDGHITGQTWLDNCCSVANINSAVGTDLAGCCAKLKSTSSLFSPGSTCCQALNADPVTGKSSVDNQIYSGCIDACNLESTFSNGNSVYNETAVAKSCCDGGYGKAASNWEYYCCGMRKSSDAWTYSGSSYYSAPNAKCCPYRYSGKVYAYVPSYMTNTCPIGGEQNKCSDYYNASAGFYCGLEDACKAWAYLETNTKPSDVKACCDKMYKSVADGGYGNISNRESECCANSEFKKSMPGGHPVCCKSMTISCSGSDTGGITNNMYDASITCSVSGCLYNHYAGVSRVATGYADYGTNSGIDLSTVDSSMVSSASWSHVYGGEYSNPNICRSCSIVSINPGKAIEWDSPCLDGDTIYLGDGKWKKDGGPYHQRKKCKVSCWESGGKVSCKNSY